MKKILILIATSIFAFSCTNDNLGNIDTLILNQDKLDKYDVVLQKRSSELPDKWERPSPRIQTKSSGANDFMPDDYLGHSYKIAEGNGIIGDNDNTGFKVINTELIQAGKDRDYVSNISQNKSFSEAMSYSNFERYYEKETKTKRIKSGFELNVKLFKIGHKKKITQTFIKEQTQIKNAIYGEVNAYMTTGKHTLNTTTATLNKISTEYLSPSFLEDLYYSPMAEILDNYGECVLTGYYTGGRAHALYIGQSFDDKSMTSNEKNMDSNLYSSFTWGGAKPSDVDKELTTKATSSEPSGSASGNFGFGKGYGRKVEKNIKIQNLYFSVKVIGGEGVSIATTNPAKVDDAYISLESWIKSLSIPKNQKLIDIVEDNGLVSLGTFIQEENLKARFGDTYSDLCASNEFLKPHIEIVRIPVRISASKEQLYDIAPVLYTRFGDLFILQSNKVDSATDTQLKENNNEAVFNKRCQAIAMEKAKYYKGIRITSNFKKIINPRFRYPLNFSLKGINENRMYKFYNKDTEMWYMYDMDSQIAFAFWYDDYILRHYGLTKWFNNLPEKPIKMVSLSNNFRIFGL